MNKKYNRKLIATITRNKQNKLCQFYNKKIDSKLIKENIIIIEDRAQLWHRRFRHLHYIRLQHLWRVHYVQGLPSFNTPWETYEDCIVEWQHREGFLKASTPHAKNVLQLMYFDLVGTIKTPSLRYYRYFLVLTNDHSCKSWIYFLSNKNINFRKFQEFKIQIKKNKKKDYKFKNR